jgi:hypothetical protein
LRSGDTETKQRGKPRSPFQPESTLPFPQATSTKRTLPATVLRATCSKIDNRSIIAHAFRHCHLFPSLQVVQTHARPPLSSLTLLEGSTSPRSCKKSEDPPTSVILNAVKDQPPKDRAEEREPPHLCHPERSEGSRSSRTMPNTRPDVEGT